MYTYLWLGCSCWVLHGWDWSFHEGQCQGKVSFILTLITEAVWCEDVCTHKQANTKLAHCHLKMKHSHHLFWCSVAGTEYRHLCWFIQPTTELTLSDDIAKHCYRTTGHTEPRLRNGRPLSDISCHRAEEAGLWKWIRTAWRSAVLPVGGLQRPCRNHLLSSFWKLIREDQFIYVETSENAFFIK